MEHKIYQMPSPDPEKVVLMASPETWSEIAKRLSPHSRDAIQIAHEIKNGSGKIIRIQRGVEEARDLLARCERL